MRLVYYASDPNTNLNPAWNGCHERPRAGRRGAVMIGINRVVWSIIPSYLK